MSDERGTNLNRVTDTSTFPTDSGDGFVRLSGELDIATVADRAPDVIKAVESARDLVTVDVRDITFIDSAGVGLLADVLALGTARGHTVALQGASAQLHKLLLQCGLESLFAYR